MLQHFEAPIHQITIVGMDKPSPVMAGLFMTWLYIPLYPHGFCLSTSGTSGIRTEDFIHIRTLDGRLIFTVSSEDELLDFPLKILETMWWEWEREWDWIVLPTLNVEPCEKTHSVLFFCFVFGMCLKVQRVLLKSDMMMESWEHISGCASLHADL